MQMFKPLFFANSRCCPACSEGALPKTVLSLKASLLKTKKPSSNTI